MRIIVNADDFGYSTDTLEATISCIERGLITSATIMPSAPASDEALSFACNRAEISFGVHLTLVGDESVRSVLPPGRVPALVHADGRFRPTRTTRMKALTRLLPVNEIGREISAQISVVADAGISVSHVDSHKHVHKLPSFQEALRSELPAYGIFRVRTVQDVYIDTPRLNLTAVMGDRWGRQLKRNFVTTDHFYMPSTAGDLAWHRVASQLGRLSGDTIEVGLHPGNSEEWRRREQESLPRFIDEILKDGHELVSWNAISCEHR